MKIIQLVAENFKRLIAIDITPNNDVNEITGPNGSGKSSLIDCIPALTGGASEVPGLPIRIGEEKGRIKMALGDGPNRIEYWVSKTFTKKNQKGVLKIEDASGNPINESPQGLLDKIRSRISFDPLDLIERTDKNELKKILFKVIGVNIDDLDKREKDLRQQRENTGRTLKKAEALYKAAQYYPQVKETEEIKVADLTKKLTEAVTFNQGISNRTQANETFKTNAFKIKNEEIPKVKQEIADIEADLADKNATLATLEATVASAKEKYTNEKESIALLEPINVAEINTELQSIEQTNIQIRANANRKKLQTDYDTTNTEYTSFTTQIEDIGKERVSTLENASWPIPGFSYCDGELFFNSIPLDQVNDADKLRVGLGIAMAQHPELRVIWTRRGSLVDSKNRAIIKEMVKDKQFQMFFEGVAERDKDGNVPSVGFYIEDGEIAAIEGEKMEKKSKKVADKIADVKVEPIKQTETPDW